MAATHLLDTSVYSQRLNPQPHIIAISRWEALGDSQVVTSTVCEAEVLFGIAKKGSTRLATAFSEKLRPRLAILPLDSVCAAAYAVLRADCEKRGTQVGDMDLLIAAIRQGFIYKKVPHVTLGSIANNEPSEEVTLYDQPQEDKKRLRVAGPFTVETLQSYEPISPQELARQRTEDKELGNFEDLIFAHLKSAGVKTGIKEENAVFVRIDRLANSALHAEGWYPAQSGRADLPVGQDAQQRVPTTMIEKKAYLHIGPKFGTVSKQAVTEAIKACRDKRDGDWLLILGFAFESGITELSRSFGNFQVSIVRMHDDLLQLGLLKKDKKAASFVTIGEPDIRMTEAGDQKSEDRMMQVEIVGLDIYDPIKDEVKSRDVHDIAYWMVDDAYDGSNFVVRQVFFCGGDKDEFDEWKRGLSDIAKAATKKKAEQTLKVEIDDEAFTRIYGHKSHPFPVKKGQKIAVRVISQFGEETTKVLEV